MAGAVVPTHFDRYSRLKTTEQLLGRDLERFAFLLGGSDGQALFDGTVEGHGGRMTSHEPESLVASQR